MKVKDGGNNSTCWFIKHPQCRYWITISSLLIPHVTPVVITKPYKRRLTCKLVNYVRKPLCPLVHCMNNVFSHTWPWMSAQLGRYWALSNVWKMKLSAILVSCEIEFSHKQQKENNCKCHFLLATLINGRMIKYRIDTHKVTSLCHGVSSRYHDTWHLTSGTRASHWVTFR